MFNGCAAQQGTVLLHGALRETLLLSQRHFNLIFIPINHQYFYSQTVDTMTGTTGAYLIKLNGS